MNNEKMKIYVACLSSYNAGKLVGGWVDVDDCIDAEDVRDKSLAFIKGEEWAIHDHEGFRGTLSECSSFDDVWELYELAEEFGQAGLECFGTFGVDAVDEAREIMQEHFLGEYENAADCAQSLAEDCGDLRDVPHYIRWCIDWEAVARNKCYTVNGNGSGGVWVWECF